MLAAKRVGKAASKDLMTPVSYVLSTTIHLYSGLEIQQYFYVNFSLTTNTCSQLSISSPRFGLLDYDSASNWYEVPVREMFSLEKF